MAIGFEVFPLLKGPKGHIQNPSNLPGRTILSEVPRDIFPLLMGPFAEEDISVGVELIDAGVGDVDTS